MGRKPLAVSTKKVSKVFLVTLSPFNKNACLFFTSLARESAAGAVAPPPQELKTDAAIMLSVKNSVE